MIPFAVRLGVGVQVVLFFTVIFAGFSDAARDSRLDNDTADDPNSDYCKVSYDYNEVSAFVASVAIVSGTFMLSFGYRFYRTSLCLCTLALIFELTSMYLSNVLPPPDNYIVRGEGWSETNRRLVIMAAGLVGGGIVGLVSVLCQNFGQFMLGFHTGGIVGYVCVFIVLYLPTRTTEGRQQTSAPWASALVVGLILAVASILFQRRYMIMVSTSIIGSFAVVNGFDYLVAVEQIASGISTSLQRQGYVHYDDGVCWFSWILLFGGAIAVPCGATLQALVTGKHYDHKTGMNARRRERSVAPFPDSKRSLDQICL